MGPLGRLKKYRPADLLFGIEERNLRNPLSRALLDCSIFILAAAGTFYAQMVDRPISAVLIFLVGVILIAVHSGMLAALAAAVAASIFYNLFLNAPLYEFGVTTLDEAVPLIAFNLAALVTGSLVGRLRDTAYRASAAQAETRFLLSISDKLQTALKLEEVESAVRSYLPSQGIDSISLFILHGDVFRRPLTGDILMDQHEPFLEGVAEGRLRNTVFIELTGARGNLGLAKFELSSTPASRLAPIDLRALSALIALAIERCLLLEEVAERQAQAKTETLKDSLLSSVSHDLRTPITVIEAAAGALLSPKISLPQEQQTELLEAIIEQCRRLDRYTSELLDVGQIKAGITSHATEVIDLRELASLAARQLRHIHPQTEVDRHYTDAPVLVEVNPALIEQAIFNLLENACKHGGDDGFAMTVEIVDETAVLSVTDNGPGVDARDMKRIFERFYKGSRNPDSPGSGLGLYIAKGFVEASSGQIDVHSPVSEGRGTRISLRFPLISQAIPMAEGAGS